MRIRCLALGAMFAAATCSQVRAATFDVTDMAMGVIAGWNGHDVDGISVPTNPFNATHHAQRGTTEATTIYDLAWNDFGGNFDFLFEQVIADDPGTQFAESYGTLIFTTDIDLLFEYDLNYSYELSGPFILETSFDVVLASTPPPIFLVQYDEIGGAGAAEPPTGAFHTSGELMLSAGGRYRITYHVNTIVGNDDTGIVGTGSGSLQYSLTGVPEPASVLLVACAGCALFNRQRPSLVETSSPHDAPSPPTV